MKQPPLTNGERPIRLGGRCDGDRNYDRATEITDENTMIFLFLQK